jgi:hypothetical protein
MAADRKTNLLGPGFDIHEVRGHCQATWCLPALKVGHDLITVVCKESAFYRMWQWASDCGGFLLETPTENGHEDLNLEYQGSCIIGATTLTVWKDIICLHRFYYSQAFVYKLITLCCDLICYRMLQYWN